MKKFVVFAISFIVLFSLFQILSGWLLTIIYTPNVGEAWYSSANLAKETVIKSSSPYFLTLLIAFISATIAYFIPKKVSGGNS